MSEERNQLANLKENIAPTKELSTLLAGAVECADGSSAEG